MKLKTLIIDDEPLAQEVIKTYSKEITAIEISGVCNDALEAVEIMTKQPIDLIFLDINMPKLSGIEFLKTIRNPPMIVLTTAYSDYALEGYELNILDYLVKPFPFSRFLKAVQKAEYQHQLFQKTQEERKTESIFIKSNKKTHQVRLEDIVFIEGLGDYIKIYTDKTHFVTNVSMKKMEEILPTENFLRIHKSFIINLQRIISIEGNMIEIAGKKLTLGNNYRSDFFEKIGKLLI